MGAAHVMTYTVRRGGRTLSCCCLWGRHGRPRRRRWPGYRWSWPRTWSCWWPSSGWPSNRPPPSPPHYLKQRHVFVHGHWTDLLNSIHMAQGMDMWWPFYWNVVNHRMKMWWLIDLTCTVVAFEMEMWWLIELTVVSNGMDNWTCGGSLN